MTRRSCRSGPPWWPANETWPPRFRAEGVGRDVRRRFFRRVLLIASAVLVVTLSAMFGAAWLLVQRFGAPGWTAPLAAMVVLFAALAVLIRFAGAARGFVSPLSNVMEAADRVAGGDYTARVEASGPPPMRALVRSFNTMTERLQNADRLRRNMMTDIAHELRTPVTVLQGRLEGLLDGVYQADDRQVAELLEETRVLSTLIEDVRTLALSDAGALTLNKESIDIAGLVRDVVRSMQTEADRKRLTIGVTTSPGVDIVDVDPVRLREVLTNLLSNAMRHTVDGRAVSVSVTGRSDDVAVSVRDTGEGMAPEQVAQMFDRFYKGPRSQGSGLGLAIAKGIVAAHGGTIEASSEPQKGTTVTFTIPR
ncbi:MAG TPA: HAMP domain-containing sensor histidine kinase [Vicinamibacterales bacterium]|nr:HAMP domain-containing sensor histidine kinase [Vicinamibacterales bacterium]